MNREWLWGIVLFARAILFGAAMGLYFEVFRFLRLLFPHPTWLVAVEDLLFFLPASLAHIFFHYACGEGETRWFGVLGVILGFLLYLASLGKIVQKCLCRIKRLLTDRLFSPLKKRVSDARRIRLEKAERRRRDEQTEMSSRQKHRKHKQNSTEKRT